MQRYTHIYNIFIYIYIHLYTCIKMQWQRDGMNIYFGIKSCCNSDSRETFGAIKCFFSLTKLPWEVSLCCPDPAAASPQELAVSLMEAMQLFVEHCVSQTLDTVHGKKKTSRKKGFCPCFCLFACFLTQISLIWSMKWSHKQFCWHI